MKPDKVQMELLGPVMRFLECMFGLGDYRLRLPPLRRACRHSQSAQPFDKHASTHTGGEVLSIRLSRGEEFMKTVEIQLCLPVSICTEGGAAEQKESKL